MGCGQPKAPQALGGTVQGCSGLREHVSRRGMGPDWSFGNWGWIHVGKPPPTPPLPLILVPLSAAYSQRKMGPDALPGPPQP